MFSDVSSLEHKDVSAVKEWVEMMSFNHYRNTIEKQSYQGGYKWIPLTDKIMCCNKWNSAQHFACDCTGLRKNTNTVMDSNQVHVTLFNVDTHYRNVINDSNIRMPDIVGDTLGMSVLDSVYSRTFSLVWFCFFI